MEAVVVESIEIDRCVACKGIWFDLNEQEALKSAKGAHKADIGHQAIGEYYNKITGVLCPKCDVEMKTETVKKGVSIQFETCPKCHGAFFDAGEFREFSEPTIIEFLVDLFREIQKIFKAKV
jgi:Zn-finger nucleic acid-binding protein